jgi:Strictosidine synthase
VTFAFTRILDAVLGRGESAITIPALDGALRPNRRLDEAPDRIPINRPSGIIAGPEGPLVSTGDEIRRLDARGAWTLVHKAKSAISCLGKAVGGFALGLESGAVELVGGRFGGAVFEPTSEARCPTAIEGTDDGLYVCHGSASNSPSDWRRDLMQRNASGSVWLLDPASGSRHRLVDRLAFPAGIVVNRETLIVSESWRHRLIRLDRATGNASTCRLTIFRDIRARSPGPAGRAICCPSSRRGASSSGSSCASRASSGACWPTSRLAIGWHRAFGRGGHSTNPCRVAGSSIWAS